MFSLCQPYDQRDHASVRQVDAFERFVDLDQHGLLDQIHGSQMWPDQFEIVCSKRCQKPIG